MAEASAPIQLTSADFSHGGSIPRIHSCEGENLSPALAWGLPSHLGRGSPTSGNSIPSLAPLRANRVPKAGCIIVMLTAMRNQTWV